MNCDAARERLWAWVHGEEEDSAVCDEIAAHVGACEACRDEAEEMRGILGELNQIGLADRKRDSVKAPEQIGGYRIVRRIAQGGMGIVYEAEQQRPSRRVALKLILGGIHADDLQARMFEREIQVLARLNHPGIASIFDAGRAEDGESFYTMELVEGIDLQSFTWDRAEDGAVPRKSIPDRLRLFCDICDAINYAHQRGVIHRDLKPSNVMITNEGRPKVLDFGLARAVEPDGAGRTIESASGRLMGTLPYMSPEQAQGLADAVDVRTDVYALGVMLYELLSGKLPYDVSRLSVLAAVKVICESPPRAFSRLGIEIPTDLRIIAFKALEKDANRRYASVGAMAEDIRRYLGGHAILARPPSTVYQLRRLIGRHRVPFALAVLLLGALVGGGYWMYFNAAREARRIALLNDVLVKFYESSDPWEGGSRDTRVIDQVDKAAATIDRDLANEPVVAASMHHTLGNIYKSYNDHQKSDEQFRAALAIRDRQLGGEAPETLDSLRMVGENAFLRGKLDEAEGAFRRGLEVERRLRSAPDERIAVNLNNLGLVLKTRGDFGGAKSLYLEALSQRQSILSDLSHRTDEQKEEMREAKCRVAETLNNLGALARAERRFSQAKSYYLDSLRIREDALGDSHPDVPKSYNNYARLLFDLGEFVESESYFRKAIEILRRELGEEHLFVARSRHGLALTLMALGRLPEAGEEGAAALEIRERAVKAGSISADHPDLADSHELLCEVAIDNADWNTAIRHGQELIRICQAGETVDRLRVVRSEIAIGYAMFRHGRTAEGAEAVIAAVQSLGDSPFPDTRNWSSAARRAMEVLDAVGKRAAAPERLRSIAERENVQSN